MGFAVTFGAGGVEAVGVGDLLGFFKEAVQC